MGRAPKPIIEKRSVYFIMVAGLKGPKRVGKAYSSREAAKGWVGFVRAFFRGRRVSIRRANLTLIDGKLDARSIELLDKVFNMDPPAIAEAQP